MNIETSRTVIAATSAQDADDIFHAVLHSIDLLRAFPASMPWTLAQPSLEQTREFCAYAIRAREMRQDLIYTIRKKSDAQVIGMIGLHKIDWTVPRFEIGFWGHAHYRGQGLMHEALSGMLDDLKRTYSPRRIEAIIDEDNAGARALCKRLGFSLEGISMNARRDPLNQTLRNHCVYALYSGTENRPDQQLSWPQ